MVLMTVSDATRESGLSASLIKHAAADGKIAGAVKFGKTWAFHDGDFWEWVLNRNSVGRPKAKS